MRKVLSFVLVLSLVLGSFSMAFAADTTAPTSLSDIAGISNEDAIQVNFDLGIVTGNPDGTFLPEKAVTRAEFAAMITRALAIPESALAGYTTTKFKDMSGYGWSLPYIAFCESKGIMLGDGYGNAMPGRAVNTNEAMTMVLRAVGYTANSAELTGIWPSNYITLAQNTGLYDDVAKVVNVDKANAAQIIYNALTVQKVAVSTDGKTEKLWDGGSAVGNPPTNQVTLLTSGLGCKANDDVVVDGDEKAIINMNKYVGQHGKTYTNDNGKGDIVAFISDSTKLVGKMSADGKKFETTIDEVEYTSTTGIDLKNAGTSFVNGATKSLTSTSAATEYTLNVDLSGKKIVEVYSVMDWTPNATDKVTAADVKDITGDKSLLGYKFTKDDDKNIDSNSFALVGVSSLDKISADNIVYVYAANNEITRVEVGTETVTGTVQSFKAADKFNIGTKTYKNASAMVNGENGTPITADEVGNDVKAFLDVNGYVFDFEASNGGAKNIAVIEKYSGATMSDQVRIFTSAGKSETHDFDAKEVGIPTTGTASNGAIIGYGLNKDGKITSSNEHGVQNAKLTFKGNTVVSVGSDQRSIASDVVVFAEKTNGDYVLSTIDKVEKNKEMDGTVLYKDGKADAKVIAVLVDEANAKASTDDVYGVINSYGTGLLDGDKVSAITGFIAGKDVTDKLADSIVSTLASADTAPKMVSGGAYTVELYNIEMDASGIITGATKVVAKTGETTISAMLTLTGADGKDSVTVGSDKYVLAKDVVVYEVNDDNEYVLYTGSFKANDLVVLYDLDDDKGHEGAEIVFLNRAYR